MFERFCSCFYRRSSEIFQQPVRLAIQPYNIRHVDQFTYNTADIEAVLESANAKAIADKGFAPSPRCASLPKITEMNPLSQSQMTALSAVRTAGVRT